MFDVFQKSKTQPQDSELPEQSPFEQEDVSGEIASPAQVPVTPAAKAGIVTVDTLFHGNTYEIPSYQREFTWGAPQVEALLNDLVEAY